MKILSKKTNEIIQDFFANSATITKENTIFEKGVFTSCKIRENDKCPPWVIRAKTIEHNAAKKNYLLRRCCNENI